MDSIYRETASKVTLVSKKFVLVLVDVLVLKKLVFSRQYSYKAIRLISLEIFRKVVFCSMYIIL